MELKAEKMKVFIIEPKTSLAHELKGVAKISMPHVDVSDFKPKQNTETGLYSWQAKATCKLTRRDCKRLRYMFRPRVFKYIAKGKMAQHILANSKECAYIYEQLMRMSAKQLKPLFVVSLCAEYAKHVAEVQEKYKNQNYPCGGIVPHGGDYEKCINRYEAVFSKDELAKLAEQRKQEYESK